MDKEKVKATELEESLEREEKVLEGIQESLKGNRHPLHPSILCELTKCI